MCNFNSKDNSKIIEDIKPVNNKTCSCRQKSDCPLDQNCLYECSVFNVVANTSTTKHYYKTCEKSFRERDMTITPHHLEANDVRKVQGFLNTYGN